MPVQNTSGVEPGEWLVCSCCGESLPNTPEDNAYFGTSPYPSDIGYGMCRSCGGEPEPKGDSRTDAELTEKELRRRMGWAATNFFDARVSMLESKLNAKNAETFAQMPYWKKCRVICGLVEKGVII